MKKTFLLFAACLLTSISAFAASLAKCALQHDGSITLFDNDKIADAIAASADGDILFLTEGQFPGFTVDKQITVRGAGQNTYISSAVNISIPDTPTLTQPVLEGLYINGDINLTTPMNGVKVKQCRMANYIPQADNDDILIDRCLITNRLYTTNKIKGLVVNTSKICFVSDNNSSYSMTTSDVCTFINCNIYSLSNYKQQEGTFINCIIRNTSYSDDMYNCTFVNTLHGYNWSLQPSSSEQNCYYDNNFTMNESTMECSYDANTLSSKGYLGNDGTPVGCYGGANPYTLDLSIPKVTSSTISLDAENKVLNVNLKVSAK